VNEALPAGEQYELVACWNHDNRLAAEVGPNGEPLCVACAVQLARRIVRQAKLAKKRRGAMAATIKTRNAR
jgi:hypothetical protein